MKIDCNVIKDLMPLYIDKVCSNESKQLIEDHLTNCKLCQNTYKNQTTSITLDRSFIDENLEAKNPFKKIKSRNLVMLGITGSVVGTVIGVSAGILTSSDVYLKPSMIGAIVGTFIAIVITQLWRSRKQ